MGYVLNPSKESREVKEFLSRWSEDIGQLGNMKAGINVDGKELWLPIANLVSICALLVWHPANPNDTITRLLFPGSTPQHKIFKGLEKLKKLECLKKPVCSPSELHESTGKLEKRKRIPKVDNKNILSDNAYLEKKKTLAKKSWKKREEKDKRDKEKEELEKAEKEKREKERQEKLEKKKKADKERREKERQERKEREAAVAAAKKEKEEKEAAAKKEKEEKDSIARKEREEREQAARKERETLRKEKEEKETTKKKEKALKDLENKKEMNEPKSNDVVVKKKTTSIASRTKLKE